MNWVRAPPGPGNGEENSNRRWFTCQGPRADFFDLEVLLRDAGDACCGTLPQPPISDRRPAAHGFPAYNKSTPAAKNRDGADPAASPLQLPARAPGVIDPDGVMPSASAEFAARRAQVVAATKRSFEHYKRHAWGSDELRPVSNTTMNGTQPARGVTLIDAMSTLWVLGLRDEFAEAADHVAESFDPFEIAGGKFVDVFETTIRVLGGLVSAVVGEWERSTAEDTEALPGHARPAAIVVIAPTPASAAPPPAGSARAGTRGRRLRQGGAQGQRGVLRRIHFRGAYAPELRNAVERQRSRLLAGASPGPEHSPSREPGTQRWRQGRGVQGMARH